MRTKMVQHLRRKTAYFLFDLAAWIHPRLSVRAVGQCHHVGDTWLEWKISRADQEPA